MRAQIEDDGGEGGEAGDGGERADDGSFEAEGFCLAVDPFDRGALAIDGAIGGVGAIDRSAAQAAGLDIDPLATPPTGKLGMVTGGGGAQGTAIVADAVARFVATFARGYHDEVFGAQGMAIGGAGGGRMAAIGRDGSDAAGGDTGLIERPGIEGGIRCEIGRRRAEGDARGGLQRGETP